MEYKNKMTEQEIHDALEYAENIIDTVRDPLLVLDGDLKVISASRSFYQVFQVKPEETEKQLVYNLGNHQWDIPKLRELLEDVTGRRLLRDLQEKVREIEIFIKAASDREVRLAHMKKKIEELQAELERLHKVI